MTRYAERNHGREGWREDRYRRCANCGAAADIWRYCDDCWRMCAKLLLVQVTTALATALVGRVLWMIFH